MASSARALIHTPAVRQSARHAALVVLGYALFFTLFFAPVLFSARLLAPADGISYFLPSYYARTPFWDATVWGGFPAVGDAPRMFWYPPALLFGLLPHTWHVFLLSAYVLAGSFTYGYVFSLTRARLSATVSGAIYGLCGFMIAHIGHAAVVHTIAWLPLIVWSLSQLAARPRISRSWFVVAALAIGCAALAGHAQMFVYTILLSSAYALVLGWSATLGRLRYYIVSGLALVLGTGLAAIQLFPTAELTALSLRAALTFSDFVAYKLPIRQLPMLVFPYVYGGTPASFYNIPYFGAWPSSADGWGASELTGYAGLLPIVLAAIGCVVGKPRRVIWLLMGVALFAVLLAVGDATPLAKLTYYLPVVNKFRAPARYLFAVAFAVSVLAGLGINAIQRQMASGRLLQRTLISAAFVLSGCLFALKLFAGKISEWAQPVIGHGISFNPLTNPTLGVPLLIFLASAGALLYWHRHPAAHHRMALLLIVLVLDLASFGWFYEWRYRSPYTAYLSAPTAAGNYRAQLDATAQRLLPIRGGTGRVSELPPNLSKLWGITSASGYGPLILTRTSRLLTMPPHGSVDESWRDPTNQGLDLMAVRYVIVPPAAVEPSVMTDERGLLWSTAEFNYTIGPGCAVQTPATAQIDPPEALSATRLGLVGALACAVALPDGSEFAEVTTTDTAGTKHAYPLRAGRDASEWAYDCEDVRPTMQHARAPIFRSYPAQRGPVKCAGHDYVAFVTLMGAQEIKSITLRWTGPPGSFALKKLTAIDDEGRVSAPINPAASSLRDTSRWRYVDEINASNSGYGAEVKAEDLGTARVYENLRARPRVWLVPEVLRLSADEAFAAVRSSRLPDGRAFDPARVALVEEDAPFTTQQTTATAAARVRLLTDNTMEVETDATAPAFLITSDTYYPGWSARVDGAPAHIYQTDFALRGVAVPAGAHVIRFEFQPMSFYYGMGLSVLSLLLLCGCTWWLPRRSQT